MLVITVEEWPGGNAATRHVIARAGIANITRAAPRSDYAAVLSTPAGVQVRLLVKGHHRAHGLWPLVARVAAGHGFPLSIQQIEDADLSGVFEAIGRRLEGHNPNSEVSGAVRELIDVTDVKVLARYVLELTFDNGETRVIDVEDMLFGPAFAPIREDYELFCAVRVDAGTIVWPNEADLAPEVLYLRSRPVRPS
jgi:hypothetical protein